MWLSRRNPKPPHRTRRSLLWVEQLEKRELLNGSPMPALPQTSSPISHYLAEAASLAAPPADSNGPAQGWAGASQLPGIFGPLQKTPVPSNGPLVSLPLVVAPNQSASPDGEGYTPAQLAQAYGFNQIKLPAGETFNDAGTGQTIAVIDPLDDPYIRSDLQTFDQTFNIGGAAHDPTSTGFLRVVNENGGSDLPPTDNGHVDYGLETSLDVEWAHAMAPGANILLVETDTPFSFNDIGTAIETAARQPGVSVISMSFGLPDAPDEYFLDNLFTTPSGHQGVSFVASAGDSGGFNPGYPAMSPNVLSIGGTTLPANAAGNPDGTQEYGWSLGGGGISSFEAEPAYQRGVQSTGSRTNPDLAYDSDPNTGVAIYDTLYANAFFPGKPWFEVGGTSAAAPQISSLVAIADQLRVAAKEGTLDGPNQLLPGIYQIAATDPNAFHDITSGNNGYAAGPGYDLVTGSARPTRSTLCPTSWPPMPRRRRPGHSTGPATSAPTGTPPATGPRLILRSRTSSSPFCRRRLTASWWT
jgi:subtilase family serine protease